MARDHWRFGRWARRTKSEGAAPRPFMILKDFPEGYGKSFRIMGVPPVGHGMPDSKPARPPPLPVRARPELVIRITGLCGTDRANRPPERPKVVISRHDHGTTAPGAWRDKSEIP